MPFSDFEKSRGCPILHKILMPLAINGTASNQSKYPFRHNCRSFVRLRSLMPLLSKWHFALNANASSSNAATVVSPFRCRTLGRIRSLVALRNAKKKVTIFCDLNNNLGRRFWDSLYMHDTSTCQNCYN